MDHTQSENSLSVFLPPRSPLPSVTESLTLHLSTCDCASPALQLSYRPPLVAAKAQNLLRLQSFCSTFKLSLPDPRHTSSTTSRPLKLSSNKAQLERLLFLSPNQTLDAPELQLPHKLSFEVLPLVEEESGRPRPTPSLGFAPFKPP